MKRSTISAMLIAGIVMATGCSPAADSTTTAKKDETKVSTESTTTATEADKKTEETKADSKTEDSKSDSNAEETKADEKKDSTADSKADSKKKEAPVVNENADGSKTAEVSFAGFNGPVKIEVTANADKILDIKVLDHKESADLIKQGEEFAKKMVENNSLKDDTSQGINMVHSFISGAVEDAIKAMGFDVEKFKK